jgi:hypothetical protein
LESNPRVLGKAQLYILKKYILSSKKRDTKMSLVFLPKKKQIILDFVPPFLLNTVKKKPNGLSILFCNKTLVTLYWNS